MNDLFVSYDIAKQLQQIGFDMKCFTSFNKDKRINMTDDWAYGTRNSTLSPRYEDCAAPTYQQVIDWFEKQEIFVNWDVNTTEIFEYTATVRTVMDYNLKTDYKSGIFPTKEKALEKAIEEATKHVKRLKNL